MTSRDNSSVAISVQNVSKKFRVYHERNNSLKSAIMRGKRARYEDFLALSGVTLDVKQGETFAIIGDNGCGKSTLLKCMARILKPDEGKIQAHGRLAALLEVGSGFHPELSGRDNIFLNGSILGMSRAEIARNFDEIVDFAGVGHFIDEPVKNYSSGMYVRLGFSVAVHVDPEILLVDEVLAVGDAAFQRKCQAKFAEFKRDGRTVIVVAHSAATLRQMCDRAVLLDHGKILELGGANEVLDIYEERTAEKVERDVFGVQRHGSGDIQITGLEVLDDSGQCIGQVGDEGGQIDVAAGQRITLRMYFHAKDPVSHPQFAMAIDTDYGLRLWGGDTRFEPKLPQVVHGKGMIELAVDLPIRTGKYVVHGSVLDQSTAHNFDFLRNMCCLEVTTDLPHFAAGPVHLSEEWDLRGSCSPQDLVPNGFAKGK
ncbi:ABC transporter ATP-binding protein [Trueperella sp. LYQ141]|uniref:ABC transporter ATP-binding protein n=1 Tax=Trueperella sp. LYQ141 TaxID=3391058 RepID=UPI003982FA7A